ncbi:MAG: helix-hairpin-helix domain-containing protein [Candidatus Omnitrophica bacterium]|nr:helix-hairpin-helix domain-containing protein [Candidatus Omnitrophota bacterium]
MDFKLKSKFHLTSQEKRVVVFLVFSFLLYLSARITGVERLRYRLVSQKYQSSIVFPLDLNSASYADLIEVPGIGPVYAERIIQYRYENNGFRSIDELVKVKGIGKNKLEKLKPYFKL